MGHGAECFFPMLIVFIILVFWGIHAHTRWISLNEAFEVLAKHYEGAIRRGGWFRAPSATFVSQGSLVRVDVFSAGGQSRQRYTQVHLDWPDPKFRMEVFPAPLWKHAGHLLGMREVEIGSRPFDEQYIVRASDPDEVRVLLSPEVQYHINLLRKYLGNDEVYVAVGAGKLLIKKLSLIRHAEQLIRLVQLSLELRILALSTQTAGIEFEDDSQAQPVESPTCQVCGEEISEDMVVCRRCKTPHHRDCWHYFGRCSTYGCGEDRFYLPTTAPVWRPGRGPA